jgi:hypothetical protein
MADADICATLEELSGMAVEMAIDTSAPVPEEAPPSLDEFHLW